MSHRQNGELGRTHFIYTDDDRKTFSVQFRFFGTTGRFRFLSFRFLGFCARTSTLSFVLLFAFVRSQHTANRFVRLGSWMEKGHTPPIAFSPVFKTT